MSFPAFLSTIVTETGVVELIKISDCCPAVVFADPILVGGLNWPGVFRFPGFPALLHEKKRKEDD